MNLVYTDTMTLDTNQITVQKTKATAGSGNIPWVRVKAIQFSAPEGTLLIKGIHSSSEWITLSAGDVFTITDLNASTSTICYLKASASCTANIFVFGEEY